MFRNRRHNLRRDLRMLKEAGTITDRTYLDYMLLILNAEAPEQLDEIAHDLTEISRSPAYPLSSKDVNSKWKRRGSHGEYWK
jgi:hypothetical protein